MIDTTNQIQILHRMVEGDNVLLEPDVRSAVERIGEDRRIRIHKGRHRARNDRGKAGRLRIRIVHGSIRLVAVLGVGQAGGGRKGARNGAKGIRGIRPQRLVRRHRLARTRVRQLPLDPLTRAGHEGLDRVGARRQRVVHCADALRHKACHRRQEAKGSQTVEEGAPVQLVGLRNRRGGHRGLRDLARRILEEHELSRGRLALQTCIEGFGRSRGLILKHETGLKGVGGVSIGNQDRVVLHLDRGGLEGGRRAVHEQVALHREVIGERGISRDGQGAAKGGRARYIHKGAHAHPLRHIERAVHRDAAHEAGDLVHCEVVAESGGARNGQGAADGGRGSDGQGALEDRLLRDREGALERGGLGNDEGIIEGRELGDREGVAEGGLLGDGEGTLEGGDLGDGEIAADRQIADRGGAAHEGRRGGHVEGVVEDDTARERGGACDVQGAAEDRGQRGDRKDALDEDIVVGRHIASQDRSGADGEGGARRERRADGGVARGGQGREGGGAHDVEGRSGVDGRADGERVGDGGRPLCRQGVGEGGRTRCGKDGHVGVSCDAEGATDSHTRRGGDGSCELRSARDGQGIVEGGRTADCEAVACCDKAGRIEDGAQVGGADDVQGVVELRGTRDGDTIAGDHGTCESRGARDGHGRGKGGRTVHLECAPKAGGARDIHKRGGIEGAADIDLIAETRRACDVEDGTEDRGASNGERAADTCGACDGNRRRKGGASRRDDQTTVE